MDVSKFFKISTFQIIFASKDIIRIFKNFFDLKYLILLVEMYVFLDSDFLTIIDFIFLMMVKLSLFRAENDLSILLITVYWIHDFGLITNHIA